MKKTLIFLYILTFFFSGLAFAAGKPEISAPGSAVETAERFRASGFQVWQPETAAPEFTLSDLEGRDVSLKDYRGKIVFLNFWATWCPPCRNEMPSMEKLYRQLDGSAFAMVAVDLQESSEQVRRFVEAAGFSFTVLLDTSGRTGASYQVSGIPTTYIIDKEGNVLAHTVGGREWYTPDMISLFGDLAE